jgi:hypothetical protein
VYLTLFLAAIAIIVDVVQLIYNFLRGELTTSFFLKILVVLIVAVTVFGYYLWDARRKAGVATQIPKMLAWSVFVVVLGTIVGGFFIVGSPAHQRDIRLDNQRVSDLQMIQSETVNYWQQKNVLPTKPSDLQDSISGFATPVDPETSAEYEYIVKGDLSFELCAIFKSESVGAVGNGGMTKPVRVSGDPYSENWTHTAGRVCFKRSIDPELYKINKPIPVMVR